ncbi:MAG: microcin C ABC transporter permease YejB [Geminicoccaceae bacterium]|nr:microcin C ABC transporter permease YejB [Geminicoccaceae bacterium]
MAAYLLRRLLLVIPTLLGIMVLNFVIIQAAPGGPVEQMIARLQGTSISATARLEGDRGDLGAQGQEAQQRSQSSGNVQGKYRGARGLPPEFIAELERMYGFDKPLWQQFTGMIGRYLRFDFGKSFFRDTSVIDLIVEKLPVSISLGIWTTLLTYLISIPLGIRKAVRDGSTFDIWTSAVIIVGNAIPGFLFAILLIVVFAGGTYLDWFPLRGLVSENWRQMGWGQLIADYLWHMVLPITSLMIGAFAGLTMLTKNSFVEEINKQYVITARAKGLSERQVLYGHVFRNAMLIVIAGFPAAFIGILFTGSLLVEVIFSLDGLGLLGYEAAINRDYPVMFATLYIFTLIGLLLKIISDFTYVLVDPRIDFDSRGAQ